MPVANEQEKIDRILENPAESTNLELKTWLDLNIDVNQCKILKALMALRNADGGYLIIGFDDDTCAPDEGRRTAEIESQFELDRIQELLAKHAGESFEVAITKGNLDGRSYPVITVPSGIELPVLCKRGIDCADPHKKQSLKKGTIYVRTYEANNKISSAAAATQQDLARVIKICFDNREADIARFIRRHLTGESYQNLVRVLPVAEGVTGELSLKSRARDYLKECREAFPQALERSSLNAAEKGNLTASGSFEVSLVFSHAQGYELPTEAYLERILRGNPRFSGWPVWLDARRFPDASEHPQVINGKWQAFVTSHYFDFMIFDAKKGLYLRRILRDDIRPTIIEPKKFLDPELVLLSVSEVILVGLSIAYNLNLPEDCKLGFLFQWHKLQGRQLEFWANPSRISTFSQVSNTDDSPVGYVEVAMDTPRQALIPYIQTAVNPMFACFNGYQPEVDLVEEILEHILRRGR